MSMTINRVQKSFLKTAAFFAVVAAVAGVLVWIEAASFTPSPVVCGSLSAGAFFGMCWMFVHEITGDET